RSWDSRTPARCACAMKSRSAAGSTSASVWPAASSSPKSPPSCANPAVSSSSSRPMRRPFSLPCPWPGCRAAGRPPPAGQSLRAHGLSARTVVLKIRYQPSDTQSRQATLPYPTDRDDQIAAALRQLLETQLDVSRPIRLIGAGVSNIEPCATQLSLLEGRSSRLAQLDERLDELRDRYGDHVIARGAAARTQQKDMRRDDLDALRE